MKEAIVFLPGIMGSELWDGEEKIWPGSVWELALPYKHMASLLKPELKARDVIRDYAGTDQYSDIISSLSTFGFDEGKNLKVFAYDWRKDNAVAAEALAVVLDEFCESLGEECSVTLLAHSMGGLISRYYLESGRFSSRKAFSKVKCLITMGTPHRGAPMALAAALGQEKRLFLSADQVQTVANDTRFPSLYQLLPPKHEPFAWNQEDKYSPVDIYDKETAEQLMLNLENVQAAATFHSHLNLDRRPDGVRYFFFVGTHMRTATSVQLKRGAKALVVDGDVNENGGDGTVPFWSGSQSGVQTEAVGGSHGEIYQNESLKFILAGLLGAGTLFSAKGPVPEIAVSPSVVEPEKSYQVLIELPVGTTGVDGHVELDLVTIDIAGNRTTERRASHPITYTGPVIDHLAIVLLAPDINGIYRVRFVPTNGDPVSADATLIVQLP